ncbi:MAG: YraN family protein [Bacteroidaceae bacterium]|nr:YraN family protein [Bacteroidaceae bacterium]
MAAHNEYGAWGEKVAEQYLRHKGYSILDRDWHYGHKDIDIVAYEDDTETLVIVEVKARRTEEVTTAIQAVTKQKEANMISAAFAFARSTEHFFPKIRFDIITIVGSCNNYKLEHYPDIIHPGRQGGRRLF